MQNFDVVCDVCLRGLVIKTLIGESRRSFWRYCICIGKDTMAILNNDMRLAIHMGLAMTRFGNVAQNWRRSSRDAWTLGEGTSRDEAEIQCKHISLSWVPWGII